MTKPSRTFTAYIQRDLETGLYVGVVPGVPGAHTQGATLDELAANLREVLELCLEEAGEDADDIDPFVGLQQIELSA
ncbi:MAG: type II toxin-antitoxin system HicB family antitoxin [Acidobacteria bacterium]|nr:type II toxin-antitoxin system HicB family antitoxin [Acidobacteriota bacterium]